MNYSIRRYYILGLVLALSSCPTRERIPPPTSPPPPQAALDRRMPMHGMAPLVGPGHYFFYMVADSSLSSPSADIGLSALRQ